MKIRITQLNPTVGDIDGNKNKIIKELKKAEKDDIELLVLPELVLLGYPPMDLLERKSFCDYVYKTANDIISKTGETALIFGTITPNESGKGRKIFNSAIVAHRGKVLTTVHKTLLPTYDIFDEFRYFEPNKSWKSFNFNGVPFGLTICEDIWNNQNEYQYHTYEVNPSKNLKDAGAKVLVNISASPFSKHKPELRLQMLSNHATRLNMPIIYANQVGANTEIIFDGDSIFINGNGHVCERASLFEEMHIDAELDAKELEFRPLTHTHYESMSMEERLFKALVLGLRDYVTKSKITEKVLIGLSGGIDSTLVAVIAAEALGKENVMGITMPSRYSSSGSITDSELLARNLGIEFKELAIKSIYDTFLGTLDPLFAGTEFNVAEENIQSRTRGVLLMSVSNKFGYLVLNTGNKSEMAVGYCTLYGDMAGGVSILSDVYKTEVYAISRWINDQAGKEIIPKSIIDKAPSAELRPDQKDTDSLPDYGVLDGILKAYIEDQVSAKEIWGMGYNKQIVEKVVRMVDLNEYKRRQAAPGLRVSSKAFGVGRRMPIVQRWTGHE